MTHITKAILSAAVALAFVAGRYSAQKPAVTTITDRHETVDTHKNKDSHKVTTITKEKDGKTTTTIVEDSTTKTDKDRTTDSHVEQKTAPPKAWHVSALAGTRMTELTPLYGLSVSKQVLGPITIGAFGLTNGTIGVSLGMDF